MICQNCHQNEATTHLIVTENGVKKEYELCQACASTAQMSKFLPFTFGTLFSPDARFFETQPVCSHCGTTLKQFQQSSIIGCQNCYQDLYSGIAPTLRSVQKTIKHVGRGPNIDMETTGKISDQLSLEQEELHKLLAEIEFAVLKEDYEKAAMLRDKIKIIKDKMQKVNYDEDSKDLEVDDSPEKGED